MTPTLQTQISAFISTVHSKNALVFTTFSLDEIALVKLLKKHAIRKEQRIVVYHEVMKHKSPGFLRVHYPNSAVISVILDKKAGSRYCPVFHSKIWMEVSEKPFCCIQLVVLSGNLSRYHLSSGIHTCETFSHWRDRKIVIASELFSKKAIFENNGGRIKLNPSSIVVDDRETVLQIKSIPKPVYKIIADFMQGSEEELVGCAAPFVYKEPVNRMAADRIGIWSGARKDGTKLHAKILEFKKHLIIGSPNLSVQAYGLSKYGIINHETIVIMGKPGNFSLKKHLKGFDRIDFNIVGKDDQSRAEQAEDPDGDNNWIEKKSRAAKGPRSVTLHINHSTGRAEIGIKGKVAGAKKIVLHNQLDGTLEDEQIMQSPPKSILRFNTKRQQELLVKAVETGPVAVTGRKGKNIIWSRELDLGDYWKMIEPTVFSSKKGKKKRGRKRKKEGKGVVEFTDVRDQRVQALKNEITLQSQLWQRWISEYGGKSEVIPDWCIEIADLVRDIRNG